MNRFHIAECLRPCPVGKDRDLHRNQMAAIREACKQAGLKVTARFPFTDVGLMHAKGYVEKQKAALAHLDFAEPFLTEGCTL